MIDEFQIAKLQLAPGDVLVVRCNQTVTQDIAMQVREYVKGHLPADIEVLVITPEIELSVVKKTE
jgi:hypothetical protein